MIVARVCSQFQMMIKSEIIINSCRISIRYVVKMVKKGTHVKIFANIQMACSDPTCIIE